MSSHNAWDEPIEQVILINENRQQEREAIRDLDMCMH